MRIMLDTNILISVGLFPNERTISFLQKLTQNHRIVLCTYIVDELCAVARRKFPNKLQKIELFLQKLPFTLVHTPTARLVDVSIRDEDDYPVLMSAILADVDILITGDKDFEDVQVRRPKIITISNFMEDNF